MNFQEMILRLNTFWAAQGCVLWQPHHVQVGAGTANPATILRVLGPEPWNAAYPEPSARPADGRYGQNPNRWGQYFQYQVILKPGPSNHMDLYLQSLRALGIATTDHDIRFVEDNWQAPPLAAWGLGWEVWLDGLEITQYTYFQQAAGIDLDPVAVEITYGLERIALFLQGVASFPDIAWQGDLTYGDLRLPEEIDYCRYNFDEANVDRLRRMYDLFEEEARSAIAKGLVLPAHDYILRCSHTFNVLDARGAVGVTERAHFFGRMRELTRLVAAAYLQQRETLGYPFQDRASARLASPPAGRVNPVATSVEEPADVLIEIGTEELPPQDLDSALEQLAAALPTHLSATRLDHGTIRIDGTPRRLVVRIEQVAPRARDDERVVKGPPAALAFDAQGQPTKAAAGFARGQGVAVDALQVQDIDGKPYLMARRTVTGAGALEILGALIPKAIAGLRFPLTMRWNETQVAFSRPIRWIVALFGSALIDTTYAGTVSDRLTYGLRPNGAPVLPLAGAADYGPVMAREGITVEGAQRREAIRQQVAALAAANGGEVPDDPELLAEVTNLVEQPVAVAGQFDPGFLRLPAEVLVTVMKKHQRYFPLVRNGGLLPAFITISNGGSAHAAGIRRGNEAVLRARFSDARFFYETDRRIPLADFVPKLGGLAVHEKLGTYRDKTARLERLSATLADRLNLADEDRRAIQRTAEIAKADLATNMVVELTSLQGIMGRYYAEQSGEDSRVCTGIQEHYLPRGAGDALPSDWPGLIVGLADRLDTLVGFFAAGLAPTSSADPYGLRRAALGVVQLLLSRRLPLAFGELVDLAAPLLPLPVTLAARTELLTFLERRLHGWFLDQGTRPDLVDAVLAAQGSLPAAAATTLESLVAWAQRPEFGTALRAYSRAARITRDLPDRLPLDSAHLAEPAAQRLLAAYQNIDRARKASTDTPAGDVNGILRTLLDLAPAIDGFFAELLVMDRDASVRTARLGLLQHIALLPDGVVDLTRVNGF